MSNLNPKLDKIEKFSKVRRIKTTQLTDRGILWTDKNHLDGFIEYESLTEEGLFLLLDHDPNCSKMESQPIKVPSNDKKGSFYIPDAWAEFKNGQQFIFDVKHHTFFKSLADDPKKANSWKRRLKTMKDYCEKNGLNYKVVTDSEIRNERLKNIQFFRKNKREPEFLIKIKPIIEDVLTNSKGLSRIDLAIEISKKVKLDVKIIIPVNDYLIYWDFFLLDYEAEINDDTVLKLRSNQESKILPLYLYFSKIKKPETTPQPIISALSSRDPNFDDANQREFLALPKQIQKEVINRIEVLEIFKQEDVSTKKIKEYIKEKNIGYSTIYRWKGKYDQFGWIGLIPKHEKKGRKKYIDFELEELIQKVINERYLTKIQPSIKGCYNFLLIECQKRKLDPPSYPTFYRRIQEVSNTRKTSGRRGKKVLRDKFKSLEGEYPFGTHPLDTVEFDHTPLDIMLVDRIDRKPIGRPTLTLAFDVYSRMIYGYYVSFDPPKYLTVAMCFLMGIKPKDQITNYYGTENKWAIYGLPKTILLDNAKEFRGTALFNFCKLYNIDMRTNPIHRPDLKPYVERVFRTINESIRDDLIEGYIVPLQEKRKTQYDPEKKAEMTIEEFEQWLIHWIVDDYHQRIHTGLKDKEGIEISPSERFERGLAESNGRIVGLPTIPTNLGQLRYDILLFKKRGLNRNGIRIFGLEYNAPIIAKLRANQKNQKKKYVIKYDPRDIREIYLWAESMGHYYNIPLKSVYYSQLKINPDDPENYPISEKELEILKKNRKEKAPINQHDLVKSKKIRQEMIEKSRMKTKTAKKARKIEEVRNVYKTKATSTEIRNNAHKISKIEPEVKQEDGKAENEVNKEWLKNNAYPTRLLWNKDKYLRKRRD